jgi:hypothetical protein
MCEDAANREDAAMGKLYVMTTVGVVVGMFLGMVLLMACHLATQPLYPLPEGVSMMDPADEAEIKVWMETLPDSAFVLALFCHWIGTAGGAALAMLISGRKWIIPALIVGALFTLAGVANVMSAPHPGWFPYVDTPGYLLAAWLTGRLLLRTPSSQPEFGSP